MYPIIQKVFPIPTNVESYFEKNNIRKCKDKMSEVDSKNVVVCGEGPGKHEETPPGRVEPRDGFVCFQRRLSG